MDGFLNLLKPRGVTSHDIVAVVRRILREDLVGHLGTLDPLAVGVLPLATGSYRRLSEYFLIEDKRYFAEFTFGLLTDTGDTDGRVTAETDARGISRDQVEALLPKYRGHILQTPPAYSALKVNGRKMLDLAREGIIPNKEPREVTVQRLSLVGWKTGPHPTGLFSMTVGRGTYVRSLALSIGEDLGCGATVSYLLRERSGKFLVRDAVSLRRLREMKRFGWIDRAYLDPSSVLPDYPTVRVPVETLKKITHGVPLEPGDFIGNLAALGQEGPIMVVFSRESRPDSVVAVVRARSSGKIAYEKVLYQE